MIRKIIFCAIFLLFLTGIISQESSTGSSQSESTTATQYVTDKFEGYNGENSHCFRFTWLGPGYDNSSKVNGSCNDLSQKYKLKNTPCKQPLVITDNAEPPNMTDIFLMYPDYVLCRRSKGQVCLRYSYTYNGRYENITYMCGKASVDGEGAITTGCFTEYNNGYETEVCICQPRSKSDNGNMPCNSANAHKMSTVGFFVLVAGFLLVERIYRW